VEESKLLVDEMMFRTNTVETDD